MVAVIVATDNIDKGRVEIVCKLQEYNFGAQSLSRGWLFFDPVDSPGSSVHWIS